MASGTCARCGRDAGLWEGADGAPCCGKCNETTGPLRSWSGPPAAVAERLHKLIALARDPGNPHEAASAAVKAQELARVHALPVSKLDRQALALARVRGLKAHAKGASS